MGPDFVTQEEQKAIDEMVEVEIDTWIEKKHITEVPILFEGLGEE